MAVTALATVGVDIGTTRTKATLRDQNSGTYIGMVSAPTPVMKDGAEERRALGHVLETVTGLLWELSRQVGGRGLIDMVGVSAACVGEELVYINQFRRAVGRHRCWYSPGNGASDTVDRPMNEYATWYALRSDWQEQRPRAAAVTDLGSWILMQLCGAAQPLMDRSHVSRTGLLDRDGVWSGSRLASCGLTCAQIPTLVDSGVRLGAVDAASSASTGLPVGIDVRAGGHDHLCAALAAGADNPGDVFIPVRTSESRLMVLDALYCDLVGRERSGLEAGFSTQPGRTYLHSAQPSGREVAQLVAAGPGRRTIQQVYEALEQQLVSESRAQEPEWTDATATALWKELNGQAERAQMTKSLLENVSGHRVVSAVVTGVPTRHRVWRDIRVQHGRHRVQFDTHDELAGSQVSFCALDAKEPSR